MKTGGTDSLLNDVLALVVEPEEVGGPRPSSIVAASRLLDAFCEALEDRCYQAGRADGFDEGKASIETNRSALASKIADEIDRASEFDGATNYRWIGVLNIREAVERALAGVTVGAPQGHEAPLVHVPEKTDWNAVREAVASEREACARAVEKAYRDEPDGIDAEWDAEGAKRRRTERIAAAIRARSSGSTVPFSSPKGHEAQPAEASRA